MVKALLLNKVSPDLGLVGFLAGWANERARSVLSAYGGAGRASWMRTETLQEELDPLQMDTSRQNKKA